MVGFAADIYGADYQTVSNMTLRRELATYYRSNPDVFASRISTAIAYVKGLASVDPTKVSVFGYCFGGTGVLQYAMNSFATEDVAAMVSFHGGLGGLPANATGFSTNLLVLDGGADNSAEAIMALEKSLDAGMASWEITRYAGIEHAYTVWDDGMSSSFDLQFPSFLLSHLVLLMIHQLVTMSGPTYVRGKPPVTLSLNPSEWILT